MAIALLLLAQVPPVVGDKVIVEPTHTEDPAVTVGRAFTTTDDVLPVAIHPYPSVTVNENVPAFPAAALLITGFCVAEL